MQKSIRSLVSYQFLRQIMVLGLASASLAVATTGADAQIYQYSVSTYAGDPGVVGSKDGDLRSATFNLPSTVCLDQNGQMYVADFGNSTIRVIANNQVSTLLGQAGKAGFADGKNNEALFNGPWGLAMDAAANVFYVSDFTNNAIRKVELSKKTELVGLVTTLSGFSGDAGSLDGVLEVAQFSGPAGLALDGRGSLYVADCNNHVIRKINLSIGEVTTLAGVAGTSGTNDTSLDYDALFNHPTALAVDSAGNVFVADSGNYTIRKITPTGNVTTVAGNPGVSGSLDGKGSAASFGAIMGLALDSEGNLYATDGNSTVRLITRSGDVTTMAGIAGAPGRADGFWTNATFNGPVGIYLDADGSGYIVDQDNHTIRKAVRVDKTPIAPVLFVPSIVTGKQGTLLSVDIRTKGYTPMTFRTTELPSGLYLDPMTGSIFGIPLVSGVIPVTLTAENIYGKTSQTITFKLDPTPVRITSAATVTGTAGKPFKYTISSTPTGTKFWAIGLPQSLVVNSDNGKIEGVPVIGGEYDAVIWAATDFGAASANLHLSIAQQSVNGLQITNVTVAYSKPYLVDVAFNLFDKNGDAVVLPASSFTVNCYENAVKVNPDYTGVLLQNMARQLKAGIVLDYSAFMGLQDQNGNGTPDAMEAMEKTAKAFVSIMPPSARIGITEFHAADTQPANVVSFPTGLNVSDKTLVVSNLDKILSGYVKANYSGPRLWDAMSIMLQNFGGAPTTSEGRAVVVFTQGTDTSSSLVTSPNTLGSVTNSGVRLYFVVYNSAYDKNLDTLAKVSGGAVFSASDSDLVAKLATVSRDLSASYNLRWASLNRTTNALQVSFDLSSGTSKASWNVGVMPLVTNGFKITTKTNDDGSTTSTTNAITSGGRPEIVVTNVTLEDGTVTNYTITNWLAPLFPDFVATAQATNIYQGTNLYNGTNTAQAVASTRGPSEGLGALSLTNDPWALPRKVVLSSSYIPRSIRHLTIRYRANWPCTPELVNTGSGQIMEGWKMTKTSDGTNVTLTAVSANTNDLTTSIPFAAEGALMQFTFRDMTNVQQAFSLFSVDNTVYTNTAGYLNQAFVLLTNTAAYMSNCPAMTNGTPWPWLLSYGVATNKGGTNFAVVPSGTNYVLNTNLALAETSDNDNDGMPNYKEYIAGTAPNNKLSVLKVVKTDLTNGNFAQITFTAVPSRTYDLQASTVVSSNQVDWVTILKDIPGTLVGTNGNILISDPRVKMSIPKQFYKISVK